MTEQREMDSTIVEPFQIAIDGPSGSGKSTVARHIATALGIDYIDTGAMYRAIALKILKTDTTIAEGEKAPQPALARLLEETDVDFLDGRILLDGADVSGEIRTSEVTAMASRSSAFSIVREKLVFMQRRMGEKKPVVMDGRDIGTNVFRQARFKFFMTASPEERARRRHKELGEGGQDIPFSQVLSDINRRDYDDSHRALNPLTQAEDAILIDTDGLSADEVSALILKYVISNTQLPTR